jgi:hypothetical protein
MRVEGGIPVAKIKGTGMLPVVKNLRANKEAAKKVLPLELQGYLEERIIVFGWYAAEDHLALLKALVTILPQEPAQSYEILGRASAREDLSGVYRNALKEGDPLGMLRAGALVWRNYHDTGRILITPEDEGRARVDLVGYEATSEEMCAINTAWIKEELALSGAKEIEIAHSRCCLRGDELCRWECKWKEPEAL